MSKQLADIGKRLTPTLQKDALLKLLKQAAALLTEVEQSPSQSTVSAMKPCTEALVLPALLRHKDKDVRLLVATCLSEIMRIVAPEAPYEDDVLKDIFQLIVAIFQGLNDVSSPSFARRVNILETVAKVRSCVVMLDLECDDLILEMFHVFFNTASEEHPQNVFVAMRNILALVIKESEEISQPMLEVVLTNILKDNKNVSPAAHKLAVAVVERCADKLEPYVQKFLTSVMLEGKHEESDLQEDYHDIIYEIYTCAPQMLLAVIPNLTQELVTDLIDVRLKAVELLGRLFALPGRHVAQEYKQLFSEFLKRFSDKAFEVRLAVVECAKACVEANPTGPEAAEILAGLNDRVLDFDERVRMSVVKCLCGLINFNPKWVPMHMIKRVAERLRDKKFSVREDTLHKLAEVYRTYTSKCNEGLSSIDEQFEWIPGKIVRCLYDKDFRPQSIEIVFTDELFRTDLPMEQRAKHWIAMFALFDKIDERAFRNILGRKQRLQMEMQTYLGLRKKSKEDDSPDVQKKIQASFKAIASSFADPSKAEESLQKVHQIKDNNIFKSLTVLLTPSTPFKQSLTTRGDLLKRIGEKHPQHDFIKILATKCSFLLFNKEHVQAVLKDLTINKQSGNKDYLAASLSLLVEFARFFPTLLEGTEGDLLELLKESDETIKEGVVHVLSKAGGSIRAEISTEESSVDLTLEQLCLEGNRKQAKHAVSAIAAISADSGLKALSVLYGRLVDLLEDKIHLPTILQSLGCIAENAIPVFETREEEVVRFVVRNLLKRENVQREGWKPDFDNPSEECLLKIYGVKSLVKSFLPHKDAQLRTAKLKGLLSVMAKLLTTGEVSDDIKSSDIDRANLRLAAGKGVLRLARRWDSQISPAVVHSTLSLAHDPAIEVRHKFLSKVHQYLKERMLHQKYACVFALVSVDPSREIVTDGKRYLADFVDSSRREAKSKQLSISAQIEGTTITQHPEYVLTYLVHVLAHQPKFPAEASADTSAYEPTYKQLMIYLRALVHQDGEGRSDPGKKEDVDNLPAILAIFRTIKAAEDLVDKDKSERLYAICDIGIVITKELGKKKHFSGEYPGVIPLPSALYRATEVAAEDEGTSKSKIDGSHLPACFADSDVLTRLRTVGAATKAGQPSSPRGSKRDRRTLDGDWSSDEGDKDEEGDVHAKRAKHDGPVDAGVSEGAKGKLESAGAPAVKESRGRKKANGDAHKEGVVKASKEARKEEDAPSPKRKRGRPKAASKASTSGEASGDSTPLARKREDPVEKVKGKKAIGEKAASKIDSQGSPKRMNDSAKKSLGRVLKLTAVDTAKPDTPETSRSGREKRSAEAMRSPIGTPRRLPPKQRPSVSEKSPAVKEAASLKNEELIGCKIKVYWPLDKRFYKGEVAGYDSKKGKHKILYDDGEVEHLVLASERWEILDSSKAQGKKVAAEIASPAPSSGTQSGKLKRKAAAQTVDNGSQSSGPSEKKRAVTKVPPKEASAQTLQGVGRGLAQARSRPLTSPTPKSVKNAASVSASPFEFYDDDLPANEKGNKSQKGSSSEASQRAGSRMTFKVKRSTERESKDNRGKQKSAEKVKAVKPKGRIGKGRDLTNSKFQGKPDNSKNKSEPEKRKGAATLDRQKEEKAGTKRSLGDVEARKGQRDSTKSKSKGDDEFVKETESSNVETSKRKGRNEKSRGNVARGIETLKDDSEKVMEKADSEKPVSKTTDKKQKLREEIDGSEADLEDESEEKEALVDQSKKDAKGAQKDVEVGTGVEKSAKVTNEAEKKVTKERREAKEAEKEAKKTEAEREAEREAEKKAKEEAEKSKKEAEKTEKAEKAKKEAEEAEKAMKEAEEEAREAEKAKKKAEEEAKEAEKAKKTAEEEAKEAEKAKKKAEEEAKEAEKALEKAKQEEKEAKEAEKRARKDAKEEGKGTKVTQKKAAEAKEVEKETKEVKEGDSKAAEAGKGPGKEETKKAEKVTKEAEQEGQKVTKDAEQGAEKVTSEAEQEAEKKTRKIVEKEAEKQVTKPAEKEVKETQKKSEVEGKVDPRAENDKPKSDLREKVTDTLAKEIVSPSQHSDVMDGKKAKTASEAANDVEPVREDPPVEKAGTLAGASGIDATKSKKELAQKDENASKKNAVASKNDSGEAKKDDDEELSVKD